MSVALQLGPRPVNIAQSSGGGTAQRGLVFLTVGQSLSQRRNYSSGADKITSVSSSAYMIAGGADRNADADVSPNVTAFNADGADYESLTAFVPSATQGGKVDGFAFATDRPTVAGIYAIGGRDYTELCHGGSSLFKDTAMFINQAVYLLQQEGVSGVDIVISFAHGEAETDNTVAGGGAGSPTSGATYKKYLEEWFWDLTLFCRAALGDPTYEPTFLVHQMAGVFNDAWREIMQATIEFADETSRSVYLTGPTAPYGLEADKTHPPGEAQALMGEWDWHLYQRVLNEEGTCVRALPFSKSGATITVPHTSPFGGNVEVGINTGNMTDASGFQSSGDLCVLGVEVLNAGTRLSIASVTPSVSSTVIVLDSDPGAVDPEVRFGLMTAPGGLTAVPSTVSRCNIRSDWEGIASAYIDGYTHEGWVIHESVEAA